MRKKIGDILHLQDGDYEIKAIRDRQQDARAIAKSMGLGFTVIGNTCYICKRVPTLFDPPCTR